MDVDGVKTLARGGELRFSELQRQVPGVSQKMPAVILRNLVRDGLASRRVEDTVPPRVYYRLTELGTSSEVPLAALRDRAEEHMGAIDLAHALTDQAPERAQTPAADRG